MLSLTQIFGSIFCTFFHSQIFRSFSTLLKEPPTKPPPTSLGGGFNTLFINNICTFSSLANSPYSHSPTPIGESFVFVGIFIVLGRAPTRDATTESPFASGIASLSSTLEQIVQNDNSGKRERFADRSGTPPGLRMTKMFVCH
jgi:hypothetical protein